MFLPAPLTQLTQRLVGRPFIILVQHGPVAPSFVQLMRFYFYVRIMSSPTAC
jgi:hypothetical protein